MKFGYAIAVTGFLAGCTRPNLDLAPLEVSLGQSSSEGAGMCGRAGEVCEAHSITCCDRNQVATACPTSMICPLSCTGNAECTGANVDAPFKDLFTGSCPAGASKECELACPTYTWCQTPNQRRGMCLDGRCYEQCDKATEETCLSDTKYDLLFPCRWDGNRPEGQRCFIDEEPCKGAVAEVPCVGYDGAKGKCQRLIVPNSEANNNLTLEEKGPWFCKTCTQVNQAAVTPADCCTGKLLQKNAEIEACKGCAADTDCPADFPSCGAGGQCQCGPNSCAAGSSCVGGKCTKPVGPASPQGPTPGANGRGLPPIIKEPPQPMPYKQPEPMLTGGGGTGKPPPSVSSSPKEPAAPVPKKKPVLKAPTKKKTSWWNKVGSAVGSAVGGFR